MCLDLFFISYSLVSLVTVSAALW